MNQRRSDVLITGREIKIAIVGLLVFGGVLGSQVLIKANKEKQADQRYQCMKEVVPLLTENLSLSREEAETVATKGCSSRKGREEVMKLIEESKTR